jgi:hypothetical protein
MPRASPCADFGSFAFLCAKFPDALYTPANSFLLKTFNDKTVIFEEFHEKIDKNDSLSLTVFFLSNSTATS